MSLVVPVFLGLAFEQHMLAERPARLVREVVLYPDLPSKLSLLHFVVHHLNVLQNILIVVVLVLGSQLVELFIEVEAKQDLGSLLQLGVPESIEHLMFKALLGREAKVGVELQHCLQELYEILRSVFVSFFQACALAAVVLHLFGVLNDLRIRDEGEVLFILFTDDLEDLDQLILITDRMQALSAGIVMSR